MLSETRDLPEDEIKNGIIFNPTGKCFDDALNYLSAIGRMDPEAFRKNLDNYRLVHGIIIDHKGKEHAHAWVEKNNNTVIEGRIYNNEFIYVVYTSEQYYGRMDVKETQKYTIHGALVFNLRFGTYGPWEDRFLKLRSNTKKKDKKCSTKTYKCT